MTLLLSSCDKPKKLEAERSKLEAEKQAILAEIAAYDNKTIALGKLGDVNGMGQSPEATLKQAVEAEKEAGIKLRRWSDIETKFNALREKTTAYKTKNLH